jgi:hypothetical protein
MARHLGHHQENHLPDDRRSDWRITRNFDVMIEEEGLALRGTFVINPEGVIKVAEIHDLGIGRDAKELLRKVTGRPIRRLPPGRSLPGQVDPGRRYPGAVAGSGRQDLNSKSESQSAPNPGAA